MSLDTIGDRMHALFEARRRMEAEPDLPPSYRGAEGFVAGMLVHAHADVEDEHVRLALSGLLGDFAAKAIFVLNRLDEFLQQGAGIEVRRTLWAAQQFAIHGVAIANEDFARIDLSGWRHDLQVDEVHSVVDRWGEYLELDAQRRTPAGILNPDTPEDYEALGRELERLELP
jgi:hypothetical protein